MDREARYTIDDLVRLTGLQRRTIRFYVEKGLLAPPAGRGRGGFYGEAQLARLREILKSREEGRSLDSIRTRSGMAADSGPREEDCGSAEPSGLPEAQEMVLLWTLAPGLRLELDAGSSGENSSLVKAILASAAKAGRRE